MFLVRPSRPDRSYEKQKAKRDSNNLLLEPTSFADKLILQSLKIKLLNIKL